MSPRRYYETKSAFGGGPSINMYVESLRIPAIAASLFLQSWINELVSMSQVSPQPPPFARGDRLSSSISCRGNSNRLAGRRRHKLLVGGQPTTIFCITGKTVQDSKECGSQTQQLLLKNCGNRTSKPEIKGNKRNH